MTRTKASPDTLIAEERRRRIIDMLVSEGSVKVISLAEELGVGINTIRNDLDLLQREGKLTRVHGGAVIDSKAKPRPPYSQTRNTYMQEKSAIAKAALQFLPDSGSVFIGSGSTTYLFATQIPLNTGVRVITNALDVAGYLISTHLRPVDFAGGTINPETMESDWSLSDEVLTKIYWDVCFLGAAALDISRGITTLERSSAEWERKVIEHGGKIVVLCDSSKLERFSYAHVAPVNSIDILVTDSGVSELFAKELSEAGVQVVIAEM